MTAAGNMLESVPEEVRQLILRNLSEADLLQLAQVSHIMRNSVYISLQQRLAVTLQRYEYIEHQWDALVAQANQFIDDHPEMDDDTPEAEQLGAQLAELWEQVFAAADELGEIARDAQALAETISS